MHEAGIADRARYRGFTVAVRVNGAIGFIDTRRLANAEYGMSVPYVLSDLYQSHPRGNFSILVSGVQPPYRQLGAPLRWSGFLYEDLESPDKPLANLFDGVAVMWRTDIDFNAVNGFTQAFAELIASDSSWRNQVPQPVWHSSCSSAESSERRFHNHGAVAAATDASDRAGSR